MVINTIWLSSAYGNEYFHLFKQVSYRAVLVIGYIYMRKIAIDYANDSSALEEANKLLENYSYTDQLTGAWNRHALEMHHNQSLDENVKEPFGYIMLDVDDFKAYNDQYSHNRGDEVLEDVAKALMVVLGENAKLYRFGGEEFLIVVRECTEKNLVQIACQCREEIKSASAHMEDGKFITASFGCTMCTLPETDSLRDIVLMADTQLHIAKENGKDCVVFKDHVYR
jgi:diguanylate cyclase (GGDEF)-like protein